MTTGRATKSVCALVCALVLGGVAVAPASGARKAPEIRYAQFGPDPGIQANYRIEAGVDRAKSVVLKLRESPNQGEVTGPTTKLPMTQDRPLDKSIWGLTIPRVREAPCYRGAVVATNKRGTDKRVYRYCIFFPGQTPTVTLLQR